MQLSELAALLENTTAQVDIGGKSLSVGRVPASVSAMIHHHWQPPAPPLIPSPKGDGELIRDEYDPLYTKALIRRGNLINACVVGVAIGVEMEGKNAGYHISSGNVTREKIEKYGSDILATMTDAEMTIVIEAINKVSSPGKLRKDAEKN